MSDIYEDEPTGHAGAWASTHDLTRNRGANPTGASRADRSWSPAGLRVLGHTLRINVLTGGLCVTATDLSIPYYSLPLRITRTLDAQEQSVQRAYLAAHPNADPRIHFFGNWQFQQEVQVTATWHRAFPEILVSGGDAESALFSREYSDFEVNTNSMSTLKSRLHSYGIPGRTLAAMKWNYSKSDHLLRTVRGPFAILTGRFVPETIVDPVDLRLWRFDPVNGGAHKYSSEFAYQRFVDADGLREVTVQSLLVASVDALGHSVTFEPVASAPPYRAYQLTDGTGRAFLLDLSSKVTYLDADAFSGHVKAYLVSEVTDQSATVKKTVQYQYDGLQLKAVLYPGVGGGPPRTTTYDYDDDGNLTRITDPMGDAITIEYVEDLSDSDDQLVPRLKVSAISDMEGNAAHYTYDHPSHRVTVRFVTPGMPTKVITYGYSEDVNDTRQRYLTQEEVIVSSGYSGNQTVQRTRKYSDDGRFLLLQVIDPLGYTTSFEYNRFNQHTAVIDATGHRREYRYDVVSGQASPAQPHRFDLIEVSEQNSDINGVTFPVTRSQTFRSYDAATSTDPNDVVQSTHRIETYTNANGNKTTFAYDDASSHNPVAPTLIVDPLGKKTTRVFDGSGKLTKLIDSLGSTWTGVYNLQGQLITSTDANGFRNYWIFDAWTGWLTATTDGLGIAPGDPAHTVQYQWNDSGLLVRSIDPIGDRTDYAYFRNKRLRSITQYDPAARPMLFEYEATGILISITDPLGRTTLLSYDEAGRLFEIVRNAPGRPSIFCIRDVGGRVTSLTDWNGQVTTFAYDSLGRLLSLQEANWPAAAPTNPGKKVTFDYDQLGSWLRVTDSQFPGPYLFSYDANGNLIEQTNPYGLTLKSKFDERGALVKLSGLSGAIALRFKRDDTGNIAKVIDGAFTDPSRSFVYVRTDAGLVDNLYRIKFDSSGIDAQFRYDANRRLLGINHSRKGTDLLRFDYVNRADGFLQESSGDHVGQFSYDGLKQLNGETDSGVQAGYDGAGNRLWRAATPPAPGGPNQYDSDNRLLGTPSNGRVFSYDQNGNLILKQFPNGQKVVYIFDAGNRLVSADDGATAVRYLYDVQGRVLQRTLSRGTTTNIERYVYAANSVIAILDGTNKVQSVYTRDPDGRLLRRRSRFTLSSSSSRDTHSLFCLHDGLGSLCRLIDWDGTTVSSVDYDAWGTATLNGGSSIVERFGYRGSYWDTDTNLVKFGYRWYDAELGRWLSQDPIVQMIMLRNLDASSFVTSLANLYAYCRNSPLSVSDTTGFFPNMIQWLADKYGEAARVFVLIQKPFNVGPESIPPKPDPPKVVDKNKPNDEPSSAGPGPDKNPPEPPSNPELAPDNFVPVMPLPLPVNPPTVPAPLPSLPEMPIFEFLPFFAGDSISAPEGSSVDSSLDSSPTPGTDAPASADVALA